MNSFLGAYGVRRRSSETRRSAERRNAAASAVRQPNANNNNRINQRNTSSAFFRRFTFKITLVSCFAVIGIPFFVASFLNDSSKTSDSAQRQVLSDIATEYEPLLKFVSLANHLVFDMDNCLAEIRHELADEYWTFEQGIGTKNIRKVKFDDEMRTETKSVYYYKRFNEQINERYTYWGDNYRKQVDAFWNILVFEFNPMFHALFSSTDFHKVVKKKGVMFTYRPMQ